LVWLGLAFILGGLAWGAYFLQLHRSAVAQAQRAGSWPTARGRILESRIDVDESEDEEGGTTRWFTPRVRYGYEAGGQVNEGDRIRFGAMRTADGSKAEAWAAPYPAGAEVEIRYNPLDPADAVLETGKPAGTHLMMSLVGLVFIALGLFALA
jgi:hypothetical protein